MPLRQLRAGRKNTAADQQQQQPPCCTQTRCVRSPSYSLGASGLKVRGAAALDQQQQQHTRPGDPGCCWVAPAAAAVTSPFLQPPLQLCPPSLVRSPLSPSPSLPFSSAATRDDVVARFQVYGPIKSCVLLTHKDSGKSKGCAMVLFHKWAHAGAGVRARGRGQHSPAPHRARVCSPGPACQHVAPVAAAAGAEAAVQQDNGAVSDLSGATRPLIVKFADPQRCAGRSSSCCA